MSSPSHRGAGERNATRQLHIKSSNNTTHTYYVSAAGNPHRHPGFCFGNAPAHLNQISCRYPVCTPWVATQHALRNPSKTTQVSAWALLDHSTHSQTRARACSPFNVAHAHNNPSKTPYDNRFGRIVRSGAGYRCVRLSFAHALRIWFLMTTGQQVICNLKPG